MCGIFGLASVVPHDRTYTLIQRDTLAHRGPDGAGEWWSDNHRVGLFHRRLAIIDLSPDANQPMRYLESPYVITFNGEIYNFRELRDDLTRLGYRFKTRSDTEVILAAFDRWGEDCVRRLNGAFAFAIFDARNNQLFLARDRAGEKPLFYHQTNGTLYFASELKALLADPRLPRVIDPTALDCYLSFGYVPHDLCILKGYKKLPPAHTLTFDVASGQTTVKSYWRLPEFEPGHSSASDLLNELETLLEQAVARQLVADVPIGVLLSGGVDSSLVAAMAARRLSRVRTFTIRFPGHGQLDETEHARLIARAFDTDHTELVATEQTAEIVPELVHHFDEPMADSSMIPAFLVSSLARQHCTVVLGGDAGDELFGGYRVYNRLLKLYRVQSRLPPALAEMLRFMAGASLAILPAGLHGRGLLRQLATPLGQTLPDDVSFFERQERDQLLPGYFADHDQPIRAESIWRQGIEQQADLLQRVTRNNFNNLLPSDFLVKVDRASMANSLEVRVPFLDRFVTEFAFGKVPSALKATETQRKILLKGLARRVLPSGFDTERKQGFTPPLSTWLRQDRWSSLVMDVLAGSAAGVLDRGSVRRVLHKQQRNSKHSQRVFALLMLELWRKEFAIRL